MQPHCKGVFLLWQHWAGDLVSGWVLSSPLGRRGVWPGFGKVQSEHTFAAA